MRKSLAALGLALATAAAVSTARAAGPSRNLADYVLLGIDRVKLKDQSFVGSGDVGTNETAGRGLGDSGLSFGRGVVLAAGTQAVGDVCKASGTKVFDLFTNRLLSPLGNVTITGTGPTPFAPLPLIAPLPKLPPFSPGNVPLVVHGGQTLPLAAGAYGDVVVQNGGTLELQGGTYELRSLQTGQHVAVRADAPVTLDAQGTFQIGDSSFIGPTDSSVAAHDIVVNVGGTLVRFGAESQAVLYVFAPKATMLFGRNFVGIGQFVGRNINTDHSTHFMHPVCGNGIVEAGEQCDPPSPGVCDANCRFVVSTTTTTSTTSTTATSSTSTSTTTSTTTVPPTTTSTTTDTTTSTTDTTTTTATLESSTTSFPPTTDTTTTTLPVAICGNGTIEPGEACDPPGSACPPNGTCQSDCTCLFGTS